MKGARRPPPMQRARKARAWPFLAPALGVLALVAGWPLLRTAWLGLTDANLSGLDPAAFVGLDNYALLAGDPQWWNAVWNTLVFAAVSVSLETVLGLVIALALASRFRGGGLLRAAVLLPWAIPTVVSAQMWAWMFNDVFGVVNAVLGGLGLVDEPVAWLASPGTALLAVIAVDVWKTTPFVTLLLLAALQMVPRECYESAAIDGAGPVTAFFAITLPLIRPALVVAIVFRSLDALRVFDLVYVMTGNDRNTMTMSVYVRQQIVDFQDAGYGSAAATVVFLVIALVTALYLTVGRVGRDARATDGAAP